ncbi:MAG: CBS domain-containing protein [Candidatus Eisenbacteria bacterium]
MARLAEILDRKGDSVVCIPARSTVYEALQRMVQKGVGSVLVLEDERIVGIFTERDYLRRVAVPELPPDTPVGQVSTTELVVVIPGDSVLDCMAVMTQRRIRHVPVMDGGRLCGLVSIGDLVKHASAEQQVEIQYLREYISGTSH